MDYAKEYHKDIIFITADQKEDWWYRIKGKTVSPRIELRKEFGETTNQCFYMYTMYQFMELYEKMFKQNNSESVIEEIDMFSNQPTYIKAGNDSQINSDLTYDNMNRLIESIKEDDSDIFITRCEKQLNLSDEYLRMIFDNWIKYRWVDKKK